jgi:hypothetical protein
VRGPALAALLADNRAVIELGRLLDEGESEAAVADFVPTLAAIAGAIDTFAVEVTAGAGRTTGSVLLRRQAAAAFEGGR